MNNIYRAGLITLFTLVSSYTVAQDEIPDGWFKTGKSPNAYIFGIDRDISFEGGQSAFLESKPDFTGTFVASGQQVSASNYVSKRVKVSLFIKTKDIAGWAGAWFRVDGSENGKNITYSMDNMRNRPISGTTDWTEYSLVLDVPEDSLVMIYGVLLNGEGKIWFDKLSIEAVDTQTSTTATWPVKSTVPRNLSFENN